LRDTHQEDSALDDNRDGRDVYISLMEKKIGERWNPLNTHYPSDGRLQHRSIMFQEIEISNDTAKDSTEPLL
jgi:hypothetical protein